MIKRALVIFVVASSIPALVTAQTTNYVYDTTTNSTSVNTNTNTSTSTNVNQNINSGTMTNINQTTAATTNVNQNINSGTMTNINQNTSTSTIEATNRNINTDVSTSTVTSNSTTNNVNQNNNVNVNDSKSFSESVSRQVIDQNLKSPPPSAIAPSMMSYSQDLCTTGMSGAVQTQILGISGGKAVRDQNCERIKLSKTLYDMGMRVAAVSLLCQDGRVFSAMEMAGTPCPYMGRIGADATAAWGDNPDERPDAKHKR